MYVCIYFRILFTRAPIDSTALHSDGTTLVLGLLFILNKGVIHLTHTEKYVIWPLLLSYTTS